MKYLLFVTGMIIATFGIVLSGKICSKLQKGTGCFDMYRKITLFLPVFNIGIVAAHYGNTEVAMGAILGSLLFQLLAAQGIGRLFDEEESGLEKKASFLIFASIFLLFLGCDYLLRPGSSSNAYNRIDGILLLLLFVLYLVKGRDKEFTERRKGELLQRGILLLIVEILSLIGALMIFDAIGDIAFDLHITQKAAGFVLTGFLLAFVQLLAMRIAGWKRSSGDEITEVAIYQVLISFAVIIFMQRIPVDIFAKYDLIFLSIATLVHFFVQRLKNRWIGSGMLTMYIAYMVYVVIR